MTDLQKSLFLLQDEIYNKREDYRYFQARILVIDPQTIIGVRTPVLRKFAKEFAQNNGCKDFLSDLPHQYHEEKQLHSFIISLSKDKSFIIDALDKFLPYVDNWATCDSISPKIFKKYPEEFIIRIKRWIKSTHPFTCRFAMDMLMSFYLDKNYNSEYSAMVARVKSEEYYVKMMQAWYFATALAKQYDDVISYLTDNKLDVWVHNKTIRKSIESFRISDEKKSLSKNK